MSECQSPREMLMAMANNRGGLVGVPPTLAPSPGEARHARIADFLVREGLAVWINYTRSFARITRLGRLRLRA